MLDWRAIRRSKWGRYVVLAIVLADCVGIYFANKRLNQPWVEPPKEASGELIAAARDEPADLDNRVLAEPEFGQNEAVMPGKRNPDYLAALPEYLPMPAMAKEELPAFVPTVEVATRTSGYEITRMARLQQPRTPSRRFVSAFATDIVSPPISEAGIPEPAFGAAAAKSALSEQPATLSPGPEAAATGSDEVALPEAAAPIDSGAEAPVAADTGGQPSAEMPAANSEAELPAS